MCGINSLIVKAIKMDFLNEMLYHIGLTIKKEEMLIVLQPKSFSPEQTTIWSFPDRGKWATHSGDYRGNWPPYVPRNLILRYSKPGDWVLDQFLGSGTTLVEAKLLNRNAVGVDINPQSVSLSEENLKFKCETQSRIFVRNGDAGFKSKEIIIKEQHNCKSTDKWLNTERNFLMLAHEYIFVFYK